MISNYLKIIKNISFKFKSSNIFANIINLIFSDFLSYSNNNLIIKKKYIFLLFQILLKLTKLILFVIYI